MMEKGLTLARLKNWFSPDASECTSINDFLLGAD